MTRFCQRTDCYAEVRNGHHCDAGHLQYRDVIAEGHEISRAIRDEMRERSYHDINAEIVRQVNEMYAAHMARVRRRRMMAIVIGFLLGGVMTLLMGVYHGDVIAVGVGVAIVIGCSVMIHLDRKKTDLGD